MSRKHLLMALAFGAMANLDPREGRPVNWSKPEIKPLPPKGTKFTFSDGFECYALNQKNANRKHNNWLNEKDRHHHQER